MAEGACCPNFKIDFDYCHAIKMIIRDKIYILKIHVDVGGLSQLRVK